MDDDKKILIHAVIDMAAVEGIVTEALDLNNEPQLFAKLAEIAQVKSMMADAKEALDKVEAEVKGLINAKAKQLYGDNWQAIAGPGYKISRSFTGAKYEQFGAAPEEFIIIKQSVDSKAVDNYVKAHNELPEGIAVNAARGESIRITVKEAEHDPTA